MEAIMKRLLQILAMGMLGVVLLSGSALAIQTYGFDNITNNNATDAAIGEKQLSMTVESFGVNQVLFTFSNAGPFASSITDISFDDTNPYLLSFSGFKNNNTNGVSFKVDDGKSQVLPGGNGSPYNFIVDYSYDSNSKPGGVMTNGVNPSESLGIIFNYANGSDYSSLLAALNNDTFRVGIHVQGFASGGSESFIDTPTTPEPGTIFLLGLGVAGLFGFRKKFRK
jgi:hypothetical protein